MYNVCSIPVQALSYSLSKLTLIEELEKPHTVFKVSQEEREDWIT